MFDSIFYNGEEYKQIWLNGNKIWEKNSGEVVDEYPEYDTVVVYYTNNYASASSMIKENSPKIDSSLSASCTHLWTDGNYQCWGLNNYYPSGYYNTYGNTYVMIPIQIRKVSLPKGVEYADGSLTIGSGSIKFIRYYCYKTTYISELYPPYIDWTFFDCRKVKEIGLVYDNCYATTIGNIGLWDITYLTKTNVWGLNGALYKMQSLDLSGWNTSNVVDMSNTFYGWTTLSELNISTWNTSNVTSMSYMFKYCYLLKELDLSSFDTSKVTSYSEMFNGVTDCTIYISDKWTLGTSSTLGKGTNLQFKQVVPIESIDELVCSEDVVTQTKFTITPVCTPSNWAESLVVEYDSTYLKTDDNYTFYVLDGGQGKTLDITYKGKNVSKTITVTVAEELREDTAINFTGETMVTLPTWFTEQAKGSTYYFKHGAYSNDSSMYGLINSNTTNNQTTAWSCYKLVAPITAPLQITYRDYEGRNSSSYPFTIHITTSASQPSYSSSSNRIVYEYSSTDTGEKSVTYDVVEGTTYYIHLQKYRYYYNDAYDGKSGAVVRYIKLLQNVSAIYGFDYDVDLDNVEQSTFTVNPIVNDDVNINDLEIIYDSNYMSINPTTFEIVLKNGSQGMSHTVTYRSKADNSISKSITFYVNPNLECIETLIDFTQPTAPTLPAWVEEEYKKPDYNFTHRTCRFDTSLYGLVESYIATSSITYWNYYKIVAPTTGNLVITFRANTYGSSYPFTIHATSSASQPSYSSSTNRIGYATGSTNRYEDGTATLEVVAGETYYIHFQHYRRSSETYSICIRTIELIPTE